MELEVDQVYCMDALELMARLPDNSVDLCFADPPYNNGTAYANYIDQRSDYRDWCASWFAQCERISKYIVITPGHGNLWMWGEIKTPKGVGIWYKPGNPYSSVMGYEEYEPWIYYAKSFIPLGGSTVIKSTISQQKLIGNHPCPKPLTFMYKLIKKLLPIDNGLVLDPFSGTGTTLIAARALGHRFIGSDTSPEYCEIARERLKTEFASRKQKPGESLDDLPLFRAAGEGE